MQLSAFFSVIFACIVATAAIPLGLEVVKHEISLGRPPQPPKKMKDGMDIVNTQLPKMRQTLTDAEDGDLDARERVRLAFGPQGVAQIPTIKQNVQTIEDATLRVSSMPPAEVDKLLGTEEHPHVNANTPFNRRKSETDLLTTDPIQFGRNFYSPEVKAPERASILLHEATHQILHASDDSYKKTKDGPVEMVPLGITPTDDQLESFEKHKGYADDNPVLGSAENPITEARLSQSFKDLRDSGINMHMNADSYALFGAICDAARRRKRALLEDDPIAYYLAKRDAAYCKLPPDYFKNRAAAKAAKGKVASTSSPGSEAGVAKATSKNAARVGSGSQKTIKGGRRLATSKGALKTLRKATKSTLPKTSKSGLSKGLLKGSKAKVPTSRGKLPNSKTPKLSSKASKGASKGSKAKVPMTKTSKASSRGKPSNSRSPKLSKAAKGALKGSMSRSSKLKASKSIIPQPLSKSSKSTRAKTVKANASKALSQKTVKSKAPGLGSSRAVTKKKTTSKVASASGPSLKKGAAGAAKKGGALGVKQTKKPSTRPLVAEGKQTSKQSSKLSSPNSTKAKSSKPAAAHPKAVHTKASTPAQKETTSTTPKVAKALSKSVVDPLKIATRPKKNGKP